MRFFKELGFGFASFFRAAAFIVKHNMWVYVVAMLVANGLLIAAIIFLGGLSGKWITNWGRSYFDITEDTGWLLRTLFSLLRSALTVGIIWLSFRFYKYLVLTVLSPLLSLIAEKVREIVTGETHPFSWKQLLKDSWRGTKIAVISFVREMLLTLAVLILLFIPVLNLAVPILLIWVESYYWGFAMMDYRNENARLNVSQSMRVIRKHHGFSTGIGLGFITILLVPVLGILFAPLLAVTAAAIGTEELENPKLKTVSNLQ